MITAPYNFVPLNKKVFYPPWAEDISHDIPFSDGESGEIEISIEAKSPIFVRDHNNEEDFCNYNGTYFIPGSSVKGMVRNILEILSFSKMSFIDNRTYAVRDLRNRNLYMSKMTPDKTYCGWLKKTSNGYIIEDCGKPGRIKHEEIDRMFGIDFASKFKHGTFKNKASDKIAKRKYDMLPKNANLEYNFSYIKKDVNREIYKYDPNGAKRGTLVLTGQPSARKEPKKGKPSGKIYEFIFFESKKELPVDKKVFENFKFAYFDERDKEPKESEDWKFWKKKLYNGKKIPIFFQKDNIGNVIHFGLSYLYKLPYDHSTKDGLFEAHNNDNIDLAEAIFGYTRDKEALKGRVQFNHFKAKKESAKVLKPKTEVLGTPRASYYPNYVRQTKNANPYITYMDNGFKISGWKRYPIHKNIQSYPLPKSKDGKVNTNVGTTFKALDKGATFKGKMRYHNLKKAELGAILSALTFHNTQGCHHNLGMAKPLGYGKVKIKINDIEIEDYLKEFETEITAVIDNWAESEQVIELLTMASEQNNSMNSELKYIELADFAKNKVEKNYLKSYTQLNDITLVKPKSLIDKNDILERKKYYKELKAKREAAKKAKEKELEQKKEKQEIEDKYLEALESNDLSKLQSFLDKYSDYEKIDNIKLKIEEIKNKEKENKHKKVNDKVKKAYEELEKKKSNRKQYNKEKEKFIKKWSAGKNNKGSKYILELVEKLQKEK